MNDQQDEGRIDPFDQPNSGGISEFVRQEEEMDAIALTGDGRQFETEGNGPVMDFLTANKEAVAEVLDGGRKDTNPKDGVGSLKPSYSCVPVPVLYELGAALTEGARKYGGYNWRVAGVRTSVYIDATRRHLDSFMEGENIDPDSGLSHITKAIASLTVFRDAQIQGMVQNDDRPPSTQAPFMAEGSERMAELQRRYPNPVPNFTEEQIAHTRNVPVSIYAGQTLGYEVEVQLPADAAPEGLIWAQQGPRRLDLDLTLAVVQALRDDGYGQRVIRVTRVADRMEQMADSTEYVNGEIREAFTTVFPGDPSLMEMTEEEALEAADEALVPDQEQA